MAPTLSRRSFTGSATLYGALGVSALGLNALAGNILGVDDARAATEHAPAPPASVGVILPMTGRLGLAGDEIWRGIALAYAGLPHAQRPALHRVPVESTDEVQRAMGVLRDKGAAVILGTGSSTLSFAATESAELANIAYLELDASADGITKRGFRSLHRFGTTSADAAATLEAAISAVIAPGWHRTPQQLRIGVMFDIGATDGAFAAAMLRALDAAHITPVLTIATATGRLDLDQPVRRMRRAKLDLVIHAAQPDGAALFYQAMARANWRPRMVVGTGAGYALDTLTALIGAGFDRTMVVASPSYGTAAAAIKRAYYQRYAMMPRGAASLQAYLGAKVAFDALTASNAQKNPLENPLANLSATVIAAGALANGWGVQFDADGQNTRSFCQLQQWQGGVLRPIEPGQPGAVAPILAF